MNPPNLFQKLALAGILAVGGATLAAPQKAEAGASYAFSNFDYDISWTTSTPLITGFATGASDSCIVVDTPGGIDGNVAIVDPLQCFVGINPPPENAFDTAKGKEDPDYARGDVEIISVTTESIEAANLAEVYVAGPISNTPVGDIAEADAEWSYVSNIFTANAGDTITFDATVDGILEVMIDDHPNIIDAFAEAEYEFAVIINRIVGDDLIPIYTISDSEVIGLIEPDDLVEQVNLTFNDTFVFGVDGEYELVIEGLEEAIARVNKTPEPASMLGILGVGALGLGMKRKKS